MKLMGFSAVKFVGPDRFPAWLKVTEKSLEEVLEKMENGDVIQDKYFADLLDTETFEKRFALLDKPAYLRRALLDTIDGDTLVEDLPILLLTSEDVEKFMNVPEVVFESSSSEEAAVETPEAVVEEEPSEVEEEPSEVEEEPSEVEEEPSEVEEEAPEEETSDEEPFAVCAHCGGVITGEPLEYSGMNYCSTDCLMEHELQNQ